MQCQRRAVMARLNRLRTCDQPFAGLLASGLFSTGFGFSSETAASAAWKPILEWVPSQKGLFTLPPHRQSENAFFPVRSSFFPLASSSSTSPSSHSTRYGPLGRIVIFTAMPFSLRYHTYITLRANTLTSSIESMWRQFYRFSDRNYRCVQVRRSTLAESHIHGQAIAIHIHNVTERTMIPPSKVEPDSRVPYSQVT